MGLLIAGCARAPETRSHAPPEAPPAIVLDGDIGEWGDAAVAADGEYLYFRWSAARADYPPQAAPCTTAILLDLDDDARTGIARTIGDTPLGIDFEILLSPPGRDGTRTGVRLASVSSDGARTTVPHAQADFSFSPTYAATWYEGRLSRRLPAGPVVGPAVAGVLALLGPAGEVLGQSDPFRGALPALSDEEPSDSIPPRSDDGVRIVSFNVLRSGPAERPEPFRRILLALDPDIVLLQEWDRRETIGPWFESHVPQRGPWHVRTGEGGVAIVSRFPLESVGPDAVVIAPEGPEARGYRPVRVVTGLAETPIGAVLVAGVHLKCCGTAGSIEDRTRLSEARAVNAAVLKAIDDRRVAHVVLGGDFNLVGSRTPLDLARAGLDADGTDLAVAHAGVLADRALVTWSDARSDFAPGRLDFVAFSDASAIAARAFVLDTARLSRAALDAAGLLPDDSARASDHRPVVVDLRTR